MLSSAVTTPALAESAPPPAIAQPVADAAFVERAQAGERAAFDALVERYDQAIYFHVRRMVRIEDDARDLTQETFLRAFVHIGRYDAAKGPFRPWLFRIATNLALSSLRKPSRWFTSLSGNAFDSSALDFEDGRPLAWEALEADRRGERLEAALGQLSALDRALIHLHYREGMALAEIALVVDKREGTVKVALHRARNRLKMLLQEEVER